MRRRRRRWLREEFLAPWLTMSAIILLWWLGASAISRDPGALLTPSTSTSTSSSPRPGSGGTASIREPAEHGPVAPDNRAPDSVRVSADVSDLADKDLLVPVAGVDRSGLRSSFVESRGGGTRTHEAIDILAPRGTPVYAALDGRIAKLFTSAAGGLTVYQFDEDEEYCFYYAHLDGYARDLAEGQTVKRGQTLGYVGTTGNAPPSTPHLHFAIFKLGEDKRWWQGEPLDPYAVLRGDG